MLFRSLTSVSAPPRSAPRWWSGRAVTLHLAAAVTVTLCGTAAWWQVHRALGGNGLSWLYVFEWPAFSAVAVWLWWVLLTMPAGPAGKGGAGPVPAPAGTGPPDRDLVLARRRAPLTWDPEAEPEPLRAYNRYLADLNAGRPAVRPGRVRHARRGSTAP